VAGAGISAGLPLRISHGDDFLLVLDLLHVAIGIVLTILLVFYVARLRPRETLLARLGWISLAAGALLGVVLIKIGTPLRLKPWLYAHIRAVAFLARYFWRHLGSFQKGGWAMALSRADWDLPH